MSSMSWSLATSLGGAGTCSSSGNGERTKRSGLSDDSGRSSERADGADPERRWRRRLARLEAGDVAALLVGVPRVANTLGFLAGDGRTKRDGRTKLERD